MGLSNPNDMLVEYALSVAQHYGLRKVVPIAMLVDLVNVVKGEDMKLKDMTMIEAYMAGKLDKWIILKYGSWHSYFDAIMKEGIRTIKK